MAPRFWQTSQPYLHQGADYAHHITTPPMDFQTFLRPYYYTISLAYWLNAKKTFLSGFVSYIFRLFPIISISQKFFSFFFLKLEKIGIDEKVICYHDISN